MARDLPSGPTLGDRVRDRQHCSSQYRSDQQTPMNWTLRLRSPLLAAEVNPSLKFGECPCRRLLSSMPI